MFEFFIGWGVFWFIFWTLILLLNASQNNTKTDGFAGCLFMWIISVIYILVVVSAGLAMALVRVLS